MTASDLLRLPDGRRAQYWDSGGELPAVLFFHGCPDTRHVAMSGAEAAARVGVRLVAVNRPGYGRSERHASTQASVADDAVAVADLLGIDRFAVLGMSIGSAYALVCAARHPDRVSALGLVAPPDGRRREDGTVAEVVERFRPEFAEWVGRLDPADPDDAALAARFLAELPPADAALLASRRTTEQVAASVREALADDDGYLRDAALTFRPWNATPEDVRCPVHTWPDEPATHLSTLLANWEPVLLALLD
ncbi:alpha/beta fold hydrolase [Nocardioides sp. SR21]|uniref:alpha/beta fold hydrolase n=1 Tax=Nocardioides sp. SR21 TaxID=2919501 RepID=UPI001FA98F1E|nr:alpha/beta fold hydrolase [Nocardioides sp. SR21]